MAQNRTLSLRRESLTELTTDELTAVAGGSHLCPVTHASIDTPCSTIHLDCFAAAAQA